MTSWPAIRTNAGLPKGIYLKSALTGIYHGAFMPSLYGFIFMLFGSLISWSVFFALPILLFAPLCALPCAVIAAPIAYIALRIGYAGWLVAIIAGGALTSMTITNVATTYAQDGLLLCVIGGIYGFAFWCGMRKAAPAAFHDNVPINKIKAPAGTFERPAPMPLNVPPHIIPHIQTARR